MSKCDLCDKPAVVHEVRVKNGVRKEVHLCETHAQGAGILITNDLSLAKAQEALASQAAGKKAIVPASLCKSCGMNFREFRQAGTLGCAECYESFVRHLAPLIERAQRGATHHCGKAPKRKGVGVDRQNVVRKLLKELDEAVAAEQYERAAQLRDRLRTMQAVSPSPSALSTQERGDRSQA